jgi:hypothetical protein
MDMAAQRRTASDVVPVREPLTPATARRPAGGRVSAWRPSQLRAIILLGGTVRNGGFATGVKRSLLDLPIGGGITLLEHWGAEVAELSRHLDLPTIQVRLMIGRNCISPRGWVGAEGLHLAIERDPVEFRGTGGMLRDLAEDYSDDDLLVVATANLLSMESLQQKVDRLLAGSGDVRLLTGPNQSPGGVFMLRCGCLRDISTTGFVDLKEQALPGIARSHSVRVIDGGQSHNYSIRQWSDYLAALRAWHCPVDRQEAGAYEENWQPLFRIVEEGARVDPSANVHDSVVLAGGRVEGRATVVRSLIGPDGNVFRGETVFGEMVTGKGKTE